MGRRWSPFPIALSQTTSLHCEATNTGLMYRMECLFTPQLLPVPSDTAWWQRHISVELAQSFYAIVPGRDSNPRLLVASPTFYCDAMTPHRKDDYQNSSVLCCVYDAVVQSYGCDCQIPWERMPYLCALEVCSWQGAIQIHVYLYHTL